MENPSLSFNETVQSDGESSLGGQGIETHSRQLKPEEGLL